MKPHPNRHSIRQIVLSRARRTGGMRCDGTPKLAPDRLDVCPACASELVEPVAWTEHSADRWELTLRCPNCGQETEGTYRLDQVQRLEEKLDEALTAMLADLKRLTHANLTEEVDRFTTALAANLILPEDF
ncbi:MAG: hypothetical protein ACR2QA_11245 [Solirubrobacteraceae bacterium]